jgi:hypothetical protein
LEEEQKQRDLAELKVTKLMFKSIKNFNCKLLFGANTFKKNKKIAQNVAISLGYFNFPKIVQLALTSSPLAKIAQACTEKSNV